MPYLLDSDILIDYFAAEESVVQRVNQMSLEGIALSIVSYMEVIQGIMSADTDGSVEAAFRVFLQTTPVVPFSEPVARRCAGIRLDLQRRGHRVRTRALDLIVAATDIENGLVLVTRNVADYRDIQGLALSSD